MSRGEAGEAVLRASAGEFVFDESIGRFDREAIVEMWVNRLDGFHRLDLDRYLRDNTESTRYVIDGRTNGSAVYRRMCRVLFPLQRLGARVGVTLSVEALDPHTMADGGGRPVGGRFITRCCLVLMLADRVVYQARLTMTVAPQGGRLRWDRIVVEGVPRRLWCYRRGRGGRGWERIIDRRRRRAAFTSMPSGAVGAAR